MHIVHIVKTIKYVMISDGSSGHFFITAFAVMKAVVSFFYNRGCGC